MPERITITHDNGILWLLVGALLVWLWYKFGKKTTITSTKTDGISASCTASAAAEDITAESPDNIDAVSGRFIGGISPNYN